MAIRRLYTRQDGKWAWELVVDGNVVATDGGQGYANEADAREIVNRIVGGEFADAEKRIRRTQTPAKKTPDKKSPAEKKEKKPAQKPGSPASTSGQYQPKRGGSEVTVPKGHRLPPGPRKGEKWVNVDPTKNKSGSQPREKSRGAFTTADVRAWAKRNGYAVSDRGRVPKHISGAYRAAHRR